MGCIEDHNEALENFKAEGLVFHEKKVTVDIPNIFSDFFHKFSVFFQQNSDNHCEGLPEGGSVFECGEADGTLCLICRGDRADKSKIY